MTEEELIRGPETKDGEYDVVLKRISLEVKKGELLIVIGAVESGKTSLLLTLLGKSYICQEENRKIGEVSS